MKLRLHLLAVFCVLAALSSFAMTEDYQFVIANVGKEGLEMTSLKFTTPSFELKVGDGRMGKSGLFLDATVSAVRPGAKGSLCFIGPDGKTLAEVWCDEKGFNSIIRYYDARQRRMVECRYEDTKEHHPNADSTPFAKTFKSLKSLVGKGLKRPK